MGHRGQRWEVWAPRSGTLPPVVSTPFPLSWTRLLEAPGLPGHSPPRAKCLPVPPPYPRHCSGHTCPGFLSLPPQALCMYSVSSAASLTTSPGPPFAVSTPDAK